MFSPSTVLVLFAGCISSRLRSGILFLVTGGLLISCYFWFGPPSANLNLSITVSDGRTGNPVPLANILIITDCHYLVNNSYRYFMVTADEKGRCQLNQHLDYAIAHVGVVAWNNEMTNRGVSSKTTYVSSPFLFLQGWGSTSTHEWVFALPGNHHFDVKLEPVGEADIKKLREHFRIFSGKALRIEKGRR